MTKTVVVALNGQDPVGAVAIVTMLDTWLLVKKPEEVDGVALKIRKNVY